MQTRPATTAPAALRERFLTLGSPVDALLLEQERHAHTIPTLSVGSQESRRGVSTQPRSVTTPRPPPANCRRRSTVVRDTENFRNRRGNHARNPLPAAPTRLRIAAPPSHPPAASPREHEIATAAAKTLPSSSSVVQAPDGIGPGSRSSAGLLRTSATCRRHCAVRALRRNAARCPATPDSGARRDRGRARRCAA